MKNILSGFCIKLFPVLVAGILFSACGDDKPLTNKVDFDRKAMLTNWIDNIMLPAFENFSTEATALQVSANDFSDDANLQTLQDQFVKTYTAFQQIKAFEIGPSEDVSLRASINTYPADAAKIDNNIQNEVSDISSASNLTARGFPAMDYLLYSSSVDLNDPKTQAYLKLLANDISALASSIYTNWQNERASFIAASGTDLGSSLGQMVNAINKDYEIVKNAKIGFPAGKKTLGKPYPETCEAYYSGHSIDLAIANIEAIHKFFQGYSFDGNLKGSSLEDYIIELGTTTDNEQLDVVINTQFTEAVTALEKITTPLSDAVINDADAVSDAYLTIQQNVRYLKVDMPSAMGVLITYQDNDGD
ncbi:Imelysin [Owenweeksia hongkongensis DSM 17368]|uniref:Imelysin n=1 Tax=Owenweeksia hongkongensis (strain DSM 17368 / CIP 108786 / JCM 12287 / NRRL B-23963 / UST20020801) TaxID=926562 RepID=G8R8V4_OWEHD|nr:imelysin family protein [Owenweeksia hongkongensis]AEV32534.1 Imelysin [Owenweeksia hongkongensis DSM 17368]